MFRVCFGSPHYPLRFAMHRLLLTGARAAAPVAAACALVLARPDASAAPLSLPSSAPSNPPAAAPSTRSSASSSSSSSSGPDAAPRRRGAGVQIGGSWWGSMSAAQCEVSPAHAARGVCARRRYDKKQRAAFS